ncbi:PREDICTED: H/ACA ribonucleoprotein complex non-core subunit NAF1, partial [Tinamus guttatus]|uniref:H/ACA ribonucleoprotein complex non-core subunit NAF1 n=1 Tax=Tinamus guttatus TaxID=94827 RepID=UPI00052F316F
EPPPREGAPLAQGVSPPHETSPRTEEPPLPAGPGGLPAAVPSSDSSDSRWVCGAPCRSALRGLVSLLPHGSALRWWLPVCRDLQWLQGEPCGPPKLIWGCFALGLSLDQVYFAIGDTDSDSSSTTSSSSLHSPSAISDDDHPNDKDNRSYSFKPKDELPLEELPPVEDLSIILPDEVELKLFGTVSSIIGHLVIIESLRGLPPVNEDSIIFKEDRQAAGKIFEIFGPVLHPFYVLRFNSSEHIKVKCINVQDSMYFAPSVQDFTQYIFAEKLTQ